MRKSVLAGFDGKPRTIFRGLQVPHNDGATQEYRVPSRTISEYSLLTHRRIEGSGSYSRMIDVSTATSFVPGRLRHGKGWQFPSNHRRRAAWCWSYRLVNDHHRVSLEMFGPCWASLAHEKFTATYGVVRKLGTWNPRVCHKFLIFSPCKVAILVIPNFWTNPYVIQTWLVIYPGIYI